MRVKAVKVLDNIPILPKQVQCNVPVIMEFEDYHEIHFAQDHLNEFVSGKKLKFKELTANHGYAAIFYFTQDAEYKALVKEHKRLNKEEYDDESQT